MANKEQLALLKQGTVVWNDWRQKNEHVTINLRKLRDYGKLNDANLADADLSGADLFWADLIRADLSRADLYGANLTRADLSRANLEKADLSVADLTEANLSDANLTGANLSESNLSGANLSGANLTGADLTRVYLWDAHLNMANLSRANLYQANLLDADLSGANVSGADLRGAQLVGTKLLGTNISDCHVFGISAWKLNLIETIQSNLIITDYGEPTITVDNLEVAQFIYLLIHNEKLRDIIYTITSKTVLILGRFTEERFIVLQTIREELRKRNYIPILFDFDKPSNRDITETVVTLAHMARFVIADLTDAKSIPQELSHIVPDLPSVAVQPLILGGQREYGMFEHFQRYPWVLPIHEYESQDQLIADLTEKVIKPAEAKVVELRPAK